MATLYADLLRIIYTINWEDPNDIREKMVQLVKEIEDKLTSLDSRVTDLGG